MPIGRRLFGNIAQFCESMHSITKEEQSNNSKTPKVLLDVLQFWNFTYRNFRNLLFRFQADGPIRPGASFIKSTSSNNAVPPSNTKRSNRRSKNNTPQNVPPTTAPVEKNKRRAEKIEDLALKPKKRIKRKKNEEVKKIYVTRYQTLRPYSHIVPKPFSRLRIGQGSRSFWNLSESETERFRSDENSRAKLFCLVLFCNVFFLGVSNFAVHKAFRNDVEL